MMLSIGGLNEGEVGPYDFRNEENANDIAEFGQWN